jgi:uncharacterized protein YndB with AHSA1/START domain
MTDNSDRTLILTRVLQAPRTRVFEASTRPDLVAVRLGQEG